MKTYRVMIVYEVHAEDDSKAWHKVVRYQTDNLYFESQHQHLLRPEIVQQDTAVLKISDNAIPLERKNHGYTAGKNKG